MVRTQIYLPQSMYQQLVAWARQQDLPMAEIIRMLVAKGLKERPQKTGHNLADLAKLNLTGGPKDLSAKMDDYLYG